MGRGRGRCQRSATYCDCRYHQNFRSQVQREINEDKANSEVGARWTADDGTTHTVNPTSDPQVPDGYYHSQTNADGEKSTAVYNSDDTLADIKQNRDWW